MPLSWNEIRARAARFADEWADAHYEKGQTQTFYNEFFEVFGRRRRDVAIYEEKVKKLNNKQGFIDLFWPGQLLIEQKSAGRSLEAARNQATDYFLSLKEQEKPRYILLSDFQTFEIIDLETREEHHFALKDLPDHIRHFDFIAGYHHQQYKDQDPANIEAASLMSNLHKSLEESGYQGKDLEHLLVRIMFCLFADDTGIFDPDIFLRIIEDKTSEDGRDTGAVLVHLFQILDTPPEKRQKTLDEDLARFPYVNGQLFADRIDTPSFDAQMRAALLECCYFDWSKVSPALFGSLFQTVMQPEAQRKGGAHYTSERNILKTIHPLFMDELCSEFEKIRDSKSTQRKAQLEKFHAKLGTLTFFDPACGCGNFLILAYRELRLLEIDLLKEIYAKELHRFKGGASELNVKAFCKIDVDQFYGIEIEEFPARIAEAAMWLVDHQMNMRLSEAFGQAFVRLPLKKTAHIAHGNALEIDWKTVIEPSKLSFMLGNPPFIGKHLMSAAQNNELNSLFHDVKGAGVLDYVTAWYWKAAQFIQGTNIHVAFVSTNSITQGEQVAVLWQPMLSRYGIRIHFAHRTFKWTIDEKKAKGMRIAAVYCVIIGFAAQEPESAALFDYEKPTSEPHRVKAKNINPYLIDAASVVMAKRTKPLCDVPEMCFGSKPVDDGNFFFTNEEKVDFLKSEPQAESFIRPILSAKEFLHGEKRWCLWLKDADPALLRKCPLVLERIERVRAFRLASSKGQTREAANTASLFSEIRQPTSSYILVPRHSSENRQYVPVGFFDANSIVSDSCNCIPNATLYHFGILTSQIHMDWMRYVCGRIKSDYRYSNTLVYNNFPWPQDVKAEQVKEIEAKAQAILDARALFPSSALADLYDPLTIPEQLMKAHHTLDKAVDKLYRKEAFTNERQRVEYLFDQYQKLSAPLDIQSKPKRKAKK